MLERYHEEVRRKRTAYRIFWIVVLVFAGLLYMFFQGYYFSIRLGFESLIRQNTQTGGTAEKPAGGFGIVNFGIVNVRVDPNPSVFTINGEPYQNGAKSIFDYGTYRIEIVEPGYVPIRIRTELDKQNPFYINVIGLLKTPTAKELPEKFERVETLAGGRYLVKAVSASGAVQKTFDLSFLSGATLSGSTASGASLTYLGDDYFRSGQKLEVYDERTRTLRPYERPSTFTGTTLCGDLTSVRGDLFCPAAGVFLTGKYAGSKEKILEATDRIIRTKTSISQNGGGFFSTNYTLSGALTITGSTDLVRIANETLLLANNKLWNTEKDFVLKTIVPFNRVDAVVNFPEETLVFGKTVDGTSTLSLLDARGNAFPLALPDYDFSRVEASRHSGVYVINTGKEVFLYYKGGTGVTEIAKGEILGVFDRVILFNKDGKTFRMELE